MIGETVVPQSQSSQRSKPASDRGVGSANARRDLSVCGGPTPKLDDTVCRKSVFRSAAVISVPQGEMKHYSCNIEFKCAHVQRTAEFSRKTLVFVLRV